MTKKLISFPPAQCNLHSGYALPPIALGRGARPQMDHFSTSVGPKVDHFFPGVWWISFFPASGSHFS